MAQPKSPRPNRFRRCDLRDESTQRRPTIQDGMSIALGRLPKTRKERSMPTLQQLQSTHLSSETVRSRDLRTSSDEFIVTDQRSAMSSAQHIEEKLLRLLKRGESPLISTRRPR